MVAITLLVAFVLLDLLALRYGVDSRDRSDRRS